MKKLILSTLIGFLFLGNSLNAQWVALDSGYEFPWIFYGNSFPPGQNDVGYLAGMYRTYNGDGLILKTEDAGITWSTLYPTSGDIDGLQAICFTSAVTGFAGGWNNYFIKTEDGGDTWTDVTVGSDTDIWYFVDIEFWDEDNGVAAAQMNSGGGQPIFITDDGGDTWTQATSGLSQAPLDVTYADATTLFLVGTGGAVSKSTDGGDTWSNIYQAAGLTFGIDFEGPNFGVVGGEDGRMFVTSDGGSSWSTYATGYENLWAAKAFTGDSAYLGGTDERIYKTLDAGQNWTMVNSGNSSSGSLYKFAFTANNTGYVSGSRGVILMQESPLSAENGEPPIAICQNVTVNADENCEGLVTPEQVDNGSYDPDGDPITFSLDPPGPYQLGETTVTLTVEDDSGETDQCIATVTTVDMTPPVIITQPVEMEFVIWPPNHKYESFVLSDFVLSVDDNCASLTINDVYIVKATSDEPEDAEGEGDGNTLDDMVIADDCTSIQLRKERQGGGNGRVYTIFLELDDGNGNTGSATCQVQVPHNNGETAVDDGPVYEVIGNCDNRSSLIAGNKNSESNIELINYPNPFNNSTTLVFSVNEGNKTTLKVYNSIGQEVMVLFDGYAKTDQNYEIIFTGKGLPEGLYICHMQSGNIHCTKRMLLVR